MGRSNYRKPRICARDISAHNGSSVFMPGLVRDMNDIQSQEQSRESSIWKAYHKRRYAVLFYALLLTLVLTPVAALLGFGQTIIRLVCGLALVAAVMTNQTKRNRYALLAGVLLVVVVRMASERDDVPVSPGSSLVLFGVIGLAAAATGLRVVVQSKKVDNEIIYAALSTYLLAGIFFGQVHSSIESYWPGSYSGPTEFTEASAIYFSFVTLATLGYGDFLPTTDLARGVTVFEVIGGQLYLAVMVARLIGLFPASKSET